MKRIVLVEDDEAITDIFDILFEGSDYDVTHLDSGAKILDQEIDVPDLFILDKQISGTNGLEVCRFIKTSDKFKNCNVIMLSANPDIKKLAKDAGADDAVSKPFNLKVLKEVVAKYTS